MDNAVLPGDVVQITNADHHWFPCLIVVSEIKSFGIQGFAFMPANDGSGTGEAYIRLAFEDYERVCGPLPISTLSLLQEREAAQGMETPLAQGDEVEHLMNEVLLHGDPTSQSGAFEGWGLEMVRRPVEAAIRAALVRSKLPPRFAPELSPEAIAHMEGLRAEIEPQIPIGDDMTDWRDSEVGREVVEFVVQDGQDGRSWFDKAIRDHEAEHGPSGGAWNISMILQRLHAAAPPPIGDDVREALPLLNKAFRTTTAGPSGYTMEFRFPDIETLHAADDEWHAHRKAEIARSAITAIGSQSIEGERAK